MHIRILFLARVTLAQWFVRQGLYDLIDILDSDRQNESPDAV